MIRRLIIPRWLVRVLSVSTFAILVACGDTGSPREERSVRNADPVVKQLGYPDSLWSLGTGGDWPRLPEVHPELPTQPEPYIDGNQGGVQLPSVPDTTGPVPTGGYIDGIATHYGESYNGSPLGCGTGTYQSGNGDIVAVSPIRYREWPCGTVFELCGEAGCIVATRHDGCPGCTANHLDLSEAGIIAVCGGLGTCSIRFRVLSLP